MPDLKQALRDFVATSNSGTYTDEKVLLSKFPELKGYDIQVLRDFVATSNSGQFENEDELFSKFPEFNIGGNPVKKKFALESSSEDGSLESKKPIKPLSDMPTLDQKGFEKAMAKRQSVPTDMSGNPIVNDKLQKAEKSITKNITSKTSSEKRIGKSLGQINKNLVNQTEEDVVSQLSKDQTLKDLGFTFEESNWMGDYMTVTAPNSETIEISLDNILDSKSAKQSLALQNFIKKNITKEKRKEFDKIVELEDSDEKKFQSDKKKYGDIFDRQLTVKPKVEESQYLKDRLASIDTDLINKTEEYVVPELEYQFGDLGFKFEETGALGDYVKVTAPNGKTTEISLDNLFSSKSKAQSEILQKFIKENTPAKGLFVLEKTMREQDKKFNSQKQVDESIKGITDDVNILNSKQKQFIAKKSQFDKELNSLGPNATKEQLDLLDQQRIALNDEMKSLLKEEERINQKSRKLSSAVGKYTINKSKQGGWFGGIQDAIARGQAKISSGISNLMIDIAAETNPNERMVAPEELKKQTLIAAKKLNIQGPVEGQSYKEWRASLSEDENDDIEDEIDDFVKKSMKSSTLPYIRIGAEEIFGDPETTKQWGDLKKQDFWGGAVLGLAESAPAMIGGAGPAGWAQRTAQMYAQVSDGLAEEMESNPEFKNVSENEKLAITLPIGITGAILEEFGLRNIKGSQGLINSLTLRALGKAGKGVTAKTFRELVENEVESAIARGALTITAAGAAEFETGAAQELADTSYKALYNEIKGKKMFNTPDSVQDLIENVAVAGAQEAVGGFILGVPTGVSAAYSEKGFLKMDDASFEIFANMANDDKMQSAYIANLKNKIAQGELTVSEAKDQLNNYRNSVGLFRQLPDGLTTQEKKEAMNLLKEKRDLENYINGKDPALVVKQKSRIAEINDSLTKLSENNAVQEQSTTEIPVQSETGISEEVEGGTPEAKPEVITEPSSQEEVVNPLKDVDTTTEALRNLDENTFDEFSDKFMPDYRYVSDISEAYHKAKEEGSNPELVQAVETLFAPEITEQVTQPQGEVTQTIIEEPAVKIADALSDTSGVFIYDGKKGQLTTIGQTVVLETPTEIIDLGNVDELADSTLDDFGIQKEEELNIQLNEDNSINLNGKTYLNNYSNPDSAINQDKDGNYSVTLDTEDGQKRTFRGQQADQIVYQMKLKNFEQNGTDEQIEQANELADEAIRIEEEIGEPSTEREGKTVRKGKRKQRTLKTVKEPLTKAERTTQETSSLQDKIKLQELSQSEEYGSKARAVTKGQPINEFFDAYSKAKKDGSNPELVKSVDELLSIDYQAPKDTKGMLPVGTEVEIDGKKGKITEVSNFFGEQQYRVAFTYRGQTTSEYFTAKDFNKRGKALNTPARTKSETKDLLDLDTKDKDSLKRVFDYLDGIDKSLDMDPNELNDVTRVMAIGTAKLIVKTLKTLVNAGITLKEAIDKVAEIYSIKSSEIIDALDIASKINENVSEGISEMEAPGYNNLSKEIDNMISNDSSVSEVLDYVQSSDVYENATDVQKELLVRDVRKRFGLRQKSAPSVNKLFGKIKDVTKVTMTEKAALIKQIKDRAKGARESVQAWKKQSEEFAKELNDLVKAGKITNTQVGVILKRFSKVNIFSEKSMNRFTDYMVKVFNDSNYKNKLTKARDVLSSLKKLSKDQTKNADLRAVASEFIKIDPSFVENIDEYNDIANKLKTAVDGSKIRKATTKFAETVNAEEVISYVEKTLVDQESKIREESIQELQDLLGVDASEFSAEEINALLESDKDISKDDEKIVRASIKKAFDIYSTVIKEMLSTGLDPFTEEDVTFTKEQKELIERFMKIDPNKITDAKEALRAVDSLVNFIQNKSTAGMLKSIAQYEGIEGGEQAVSEGLKATRLRKYWSPKLGLFLGQKLTTLPVLFDKMFKGVTRALRVEELIGMSDLINNSSKGESESNKIIKEYVNKFYKTKANGESFNSAYNDIERGVFAHIFRNVIGPESRMKEVFNKRKQEVLDTIDLLSKRGNESEQEIAQLLQKVYDKILDGSENIQDVVGKTDANNVKAVEHWVKEWSNKYDSLADLALNFYNKVLGRDLNYTPDKIKKLQDKMQDVDLEDVQSQFFANTDEILYDKKSGSLMDKQENRSIPKDMYVDFSFDKKNSNAMNDALTDLYTAFDVAKVGSFLKSKEFRKVFPSAKDANLIDKRIKKFVRLTRKKTPFSNEDISNFLKSANKLAKLGVTASLASPSQPFKQTIPVMFSTAMSAGSLGFGIAFNTNFNNWLDGLGFAISNRGVESQAEIDSLNKLLEKAADMPLDKALKFIERTNDKALKVLLVNFDVWIARASFKAYYEQSLKRQGLKSSGIDYSKHEVNKEAANYAQRMVDRQQNISNPALAGDLFTSEDTSTKTLVKMLMPFSSFRTNQSARLGADLSTLEYWNTSTKEDKIIALRSITGYVLEAAAYRSLQIGFSLLMYSGAKAIMGADDDEEDKKFADNLLIGSGQSFVTDTFSPIPLGDPFMQDAMAFSAEEIQSLMDIPEEEKLKLFGSQEQSALKMLGTYGIPLQKAKDIYSLGRLAYTQKYKDKYGKEKEISNKQADNLKLLIAPLFAASVMGVGSPDMTSIVNKSVKMSKKSDKIDMQLLKKTNPDMYERIKSYQDRGSNKEMEDRLKARKKELEDRMKNR